MKTLYLLIIAIGILVGMSLVPAFADEPEWYVQHVTGKFLNSNPPKPDQVFNFQYRVLNGTLVELIKNQYGQFEAKVQSTDEGMLELKVPRNYPYSNMGYPYYNNTGNIAGTNAAIEVDGVFLNPQKYSFVSTDCFFEYSVPFIGTPVITLDFIVYPEGIPYSGDKVPDHCISETTFIDSPLKQFKSGIAANDIKCEQGLQLVIQAEDGSPACVRPDTANILIGRGWAKEFAQTTGIESVEMTVVRITNNTGAMDVNYTEFRTVSPEILAKYPLLQSALQSADKQSEKFNKLCENSKCENTLARAFGPAYSTKIPAATAKALIDDPALHFSVYPGASPIIEMSYINIGGVKYIISIFSAQ